MKPIIPSRASSSGAVDNAHQKAACELIPNSESAQALLSVRPTIFRQRLRTLGTGRGIGPVPCRCQGTVSESAGDGADRWMTAVASAELSASLFGPLPFSDGPSARWLSGGGGPPADGCR